MAIGMTTIVSQTAFPEKVADVTEKAAFNKQQAMVATVAQEAEQRAKTVQKLEATEKTSSVRREKDSDAKKRKQKKDNQQKKRGNHLDLQA